MSALPFVSDTFDPTRWREVEGFDFADITYHRGISRGPEADGRPEGADMPVVRIAFDRPDIRNAFRPGTVDELYRALDHARQTSSVAAVILTGNGPSARDGGYSSALAAIKGCEAATATVTSRGADRSRHRSATRADRPRARRAPAHPGGPAPDPHDAEGRHRGSARVGRRRRAFAERGGGPVGGVHRARGVHADGRERGVF